MFPQPSSESRPVSAPRVLMCLSIKFTNILSATSSTMSRFQILSYISRFLKFYLPYQCFITMPFFPPFSALKNCGLISCDFAKDSYTYLLQPSYRVSLDRIFGFSLDSQSQFPGCRVDPSHRLFVKSTLSFRQLHRPSQAPGRHSSSPEGRNGSLMSSFISPHTWCFDHIVFKYV